MLSEERIEELWVAIHKGRYMSAGFNTFARAIEAECAKVAENLAQARLLGMSAEREADLLGEVEGLKARITELEHITMANHIAAMEARQDERTAMSYLNDVRRIVGDCDYPTMVERVCKLMERRS